MERKIIWTETARRELRDIRSYLKRRTRSTRYSSQLRKEVGEILIRLARQPFVGNLTEDIEVHRKLVATHFLIFYRFNDEALQVVSIWDTRRNPDQAPYSY